MFVTLFVNITGSLLNRIGRTTNGQKIYSVYPAIIATIGGVGSIIGSTATTKLALGLINPLFSSIKQHLNEIIGAWLASLVMFLVYGIVYSFMSGIETLGEMIMFTTQLLTINILAVSLMVFISYSAAIFTLRRGWNPDNFVIPIESSLADIITTAAALAALALLI
jgi:mgtE-like transporter